MSRFSLLLRSYKRFISTPWEINLAGPQKVLFVIYDKTDERTMRSRLSEFELTTKNANHDWYLHDLTEAFPNWMAAEEYRESYFQSPEDLDLLLPQFKSQLTANIVSILTSHNLENNTVVALSGIACLFSFLRISDLVPDLTPHISGRLLIFFPGDCENNNYRFLDARDGWNYMAVPITAHNSCEGR